MRWRLYASGRVSLLSINTISTPDHCQSRSPSSNVSWRHRARLRPPCPRRSRHRPSAFSTRTAFSGYLNRSAQAFDTWPSCADVPPLVPTAPTILPSMMSGRPPSLVITPGKPSTATSLAARSWKTFVGRLKLLAAFAFHLRDADTCNLRVVEPLEGNQVSSIIDDCNRHIPVILPCLRLSRGETLARTLEVYCAAIRLSVCGTRCTGQA